MRLKGVRGRRAAGRFGQWPTVLVAVVIAGSGHNGRRYR